MVLDTSRQKSKRPRFYAFFDVQRPRPRYLFRHASLLLLTLIILANRWQKTDPDLWGHIRFGQLMLSSGHVVSHDPYSYTAFGGSWHDHEYLSEIVIAAVYNIGGIIGLKTWKFVCIATTMLLLACGLAETGVSSLVQLNALAWVAGITATFVQFRPQLHTYALFALTIALLTRHNFRGSAPLWVLVPVMALWSNLHGGFVIGLIALLSYTGVVAARDLFQGRHLRRASELPAIALAATGVTVAIPNGLIRWHAVLTTVCNPMTFRIFTEWLPFSAAMRHQWQTNPSAITLYVLLLVLWALLILSLGLEPCGGDSPLVLIAVLMSIAALMAVRNVPFAAMSCAIPAARHFGLLLQDRVAPPAAEAKVPFWGQCLLAAGVLLITSRGLLSRRLPTDMAYPAHAVDFMKQSGLHGNVLVYFCWGEYLIWHLAADSKVFFDSRYDMVYPQAVTQDFLAFYWNLPGADKVLANYDHDFVLIPVGEAVYDKMMGTAGWQLIYRDSDSALFTRSYSRAAQLSALRPARANLAKQYFP